MDSPVEVWRSGYQGVNAQNGNYFVELNVFQPTRLYQIVYLINGETINWSLHHRKTPNLVSTQQIEINLYNQTGATKLYTIGSHTASSSTSWDAANGSYVFNGPTGIYQIGYESIQPTSGDLGNLLDNISIDLKPLIEFGKSLDQTVKTNTGYRPQILINGRVTSPSTITFSVVGGNAVEGVDYSFPNKTLTINPGYYSQENTVPIGLTILNNSVGSKDLVLRISSVSGELLNQDSNGDGYIQDLNIRILDPGIVFDETKLWLKADGGINNNGNDVVKWEDQTGNYLPAIVGNPQIASQRVNLNPSVIFDGVNDGLTIPYSPGLNSNEFTVSALVSLNAPTLNSASKFIIYNFGGTNPIGGYALNIVDQSLFYELANPPDIVSLNGGSLGNAKWKLVTAKVEGSTGRLYVDGQLLGTLSAPNFSGNSEEIFRIGHGPTTTSFFSGDISELAIFSKSLVTNDQIKLESYLAIKYGISLHPSVGNYLNTSGTVLWNDASHWNDVFGIGKDDQSALNQTSSNSVNTGTGDGTGEPGYGNLVLSNPSSLDNGDFLMIGHDNGSLTEQTIDLPNTIQDKKRLAREWKVKQTGNVGTINLKLDLNGLNLTGSQIDDFKLLVDIDGNGDFTNGTVQEINPTQLAGTNLFFEGLSLPDGAVFTFITGRFSLFFSSELWLKANDGPTPASGTLTGWTDIAGYSNFTVSGNPQIGSSKINFNNVVDFDGTGDYLTGNTAITFQTLYAVTKLGTLSGQPTIMSSTLSATGGATNVGYFSKGNNLRTGNNNGTYFQSTGQVGIDKARLSTVEIVPGQTTTNHKTYIDGTFHATANLAGSGAMSPFSAIPYIGRSADPNQQDAYVGQIAELMMFPASHSESDRVRIQSYLAIKYGITLDPAVLKYLASDGTILWDSPTHWHDVFGIGLDEESELRQTSSNSINTGSGDGTGQSGKGNIVLSNPSSLSNLDFLLLGHDNGALTEQTSDLPASLAGAKRLAREWKVTHTNDVGTVNLTFNTSGLTVSGTQASQFKLLIDTDGDGDFTTGTVTEKVADAYLSSILAFSNLALPNNAVFTLVTNAPVNPILERNLWLKADAGTTPTTGTLTGWVDQTGKQTTTINGDPQIVPQNLNFLPSTVFDGTEDRISIPYTADLNSSSFTVNTIVKPSYEFGGEVFSTIDFSGSGAGYGLRIASSNWSFRIVNGNGDLVLINGGPILLNEWSLISVKFENFVLTFSVNGKEVGSANVGSFTPTTSGNFRIAYDLNAGAPTNLFRGEMSELIYYPSALSSADQDKVASYLATKYGITLLNAAGNSTYYNSSGTVVYDSPTYTHDVFGIGRDDLIGLNAAQSNSTNTGSGNGTGQAGKGNILLKNPYSLGDGDYLLIGHDNGTLTEQLSEMPSGLNMARLGREWKVKRTGDPGTVDLEFDFNGLSTSGGTTDVNNYRLLIDLDGDGDFTTGSVQQIAPNSFGSPKLIFTGVDLPDGAVLTFATGQPSANWNLTKSTSASSYQTLGEVIPFTLHLENTGLIPITGVTISDPNGVVSNTITGDQAPLNSLDPGETWTYSVTHTVTQADLDNGSLSNTATANGTSSTGSVLPVVSNTVTIIGSQTPGWSMTKTASIPNFSNQGEVVNYAIVVTNTGNVSLSGISVSDPGATVSSSFSGDSAPLNVLTPGEAWTYTATYTITAADMSAQSYTNTATATGNSPLGAMAPVQASATVTYGQDVLLKSTLWLNSQEGVDESAGDVNEWKDVYNRDSFTAVVYPPTLENNGVNFQPVIKMTGEGGEGISLFYQLTGTSNFSVVEAFAVYKVNTLGQSTLLGANNSGGSAAQTIFGGLSTDGNSVYASDGISSRQSYSNPNLGSRFTINNYDFAPVSSPFSTAKVDGKTMAVSNSDGNADFGQLDFDVQQGTGLIIGTSDSPWTQFDGDVAEIILFNYSLSATDRLKVESYLAVKYGISLDPSVGSYIDSDGQVIWNNSPYWNDVFGIGRDDLNKLNQTSSNSINTGSGDGTGQSGKGNIVLKNPTSLDNGDFMMIGHDNGTLTEQSTEVPASLAGAKRIGREWVVKHTGDVGTVNLTFDVNGLTVTGTTASEFKLLVDADGDFSTGATVVDATALAGGVVSFDGVTFPDGSYFTFISGASVSLFSSANLWLKADAGTTPTTGTLTGWVDQTGKQTTTLDGDPQIVPQNLNFLPSTVFDGTEDRITIPYSADLNSSNFTINTIVKPTYQFGGIVFSTLDLSGSGAGYGLRISSSNWIFNIYNGSNTNVQINGGPILLNEWSLISIKFEDFVATLSVNGKEVGSANVGSFTPTTSGAFKIAYDLNGGTPFNFYTGELSEMIYYPSALSSADQDKVASYLATKYGITLLNATGNIIYYNSSGTVVYDSPTFTHDVFGIGRDDLIGLNTAQSNSTNTGSGNGTGQSGKGNILLKNPSSLDDGDYLLIGHDNGALTEQTGEMPSGLAMFRLGREWKVKRTGNPGTVDLEFDFNGLTTSGGTTDVNNYRLLIDLDGDGDFTTGSVQQIVPNSFGSPKLIFNGVNLPDGAVLTFATGLASTSWTLGSSSTASTYSTAGEVISYQLILENTGALDITTIALTDPNATVSTTIVGDVAPVGTLAAGEIWTYTATRTITQADLDVGSISNTATANGTSQLGAVSPAVSNTVTLTATQTPSWTLTKTSSSPNFTLVGDVINYSLVLSNTGNLSISGVAINDPGATVSGNFTGDSAPLNVLTPGEAWTYTATYTITAAELTSQTYTNTATATGNSPAGAMTPAQGTATVTFKSFPGGIGGSTLWLKANEGVSNTGTSLNNWTDQTGTNTFTKSGTIGFEQNQINFNPAVSFNNTNSVTTQPANRLDGNTAITYVDGFGLYKKQNGTNGGVVIGSIVASSAYGVAVFGGESPTDAWVGSGVLNSHSHFSNSAFTNSFGLVNLDVSLAPAPHATGRFNGANQTMTNGSGADYSQITFTPRIGGTNNSGSSSFNGWNHFKGQVAEVILFPRSLNAGDKNKIESYFAVKYGVSLDPSVGNYVNSSGTSIWSNTTYWHDVFGIGRDDASGLLQLQSNSINTGSGDGTGQTGKANIVFSVPSIATDRTFVMMGHNNAGLTTILETQLASEAGNFRLERKWKVNASANFTESVTVSLDLNGLTISGTQASQIKMILDADGDGDFTNAIAIPATTFANGVATFPPGQFANFPNAVISFITGPATPSWTINKNVYLDAFYTNVGDVVNYEIALQNTGNINITGITVSDPGAVLSSTIIGDSSPLNSLDPGETWTYSASYTITAADITAQTYTNTATATGASLVGSMPEIQASASIDFRAFPGGVANANLWFRADQGVTTGSTFSWETVGRFVGDLATSTGSAMPTYINAPGPDQFNFNPVISFDGVDDYLRTPNFAGVIGGTNTLTSTQFVVYKRLDLNSGTALYTQSNGTGAIRAGGLMVGSMIQTNIAAQSTVRRVTEEILLLDMTSSTQNGSNTLDLNLNGSGGQIITNNSFSDPGDNLPIYIATHDNLHTKAAIAEIIIYPTILNASERQKVQSYLALKYGVSLGNNLESKEYTSSNGTTIWSADPIYFYDVFGIGKDVSTGLNQSQSNSVFTGNGDGTGKAGLGNIVIGNPSSLDDGDFLMIGHDGGDLVEQTSDLPAGLEMFRLGREWKVQRTGDPGLVSLEFDFSGLTTSGGTTDVNNYRLLIDFDGDGDFTTGTVQQIVPNSFGSPKLIFNGINLPDGAVLAFVTGPISASWTLTKQSSSATFDATGVGLSYEFVATNTGNVSISGISISDPLIPNLSQTPIQGTDIGNDGILSPGEAWRFVGAYTTTQADLDRGFVENTATISGTPAGGTLSDATSNNVTVDAIQNPTIELDITSSQSTFSSVGEVINIRMSGSNKGNVTLSSVNAQIPLSLSYWRIANLNPGTTEFTDEKITIRQIDLDRGFLSLDSELGGLSPQGIRVSDFDTLRFQAIQTPSWTFTKSTSTPGFDATGDVISYQLLLENTGNISVNGPLVTDPLLIGLTKVSGDVANQNVLDPGEIWTYTGNYTVKQADLDRGYVENIATANGTTQSAGAMPTSISNTVRVNADPNPSWTLTKQGSPDTFSTVGQGLSFEFVLSNTGNVSISNITINDPLIPNLNQTPILGTDAGNDGILGPGENWRFVGYYNTTQADLDRGYFENTATVSGTPTGGTLADGVSNTIRTNAVQNPSWTLSKQSSSATFDATGVGLSYEFVATNTGNVSISGISISDPLIPNLSQTPIQGTDIGNDGILSPGEAWRFVGAYTTTQADLDRGYIENTATVSGTPTGGTLPDELSNTVRTNAVQTSALDVSFTADKNQYSSVGEVINYELVVNNVGNVTLTSVLVKDPFAPGSTTFNTLLPNQSRTLTYSYTISQADLDNGSFSAVGTAQGTDPTNAVVSDSETITINALRNPVLTIVKSITSSETTYNHVGQVVDYRIELRNTGNVTFEMVAGRYINDPKFPNLSQVPDPGSDINGDGKLSPGETWVYTPSYTILQIDIDRGILTNTARGYGAVPGFPNLVVDSNPVTIMADQQLTWDLRKSSSVSDFSTAGEVIPYTLELENTGNVRIISIQVADPLIPNLSKIGGDLVLDPGETWTYTGNYTVTQSDVDQGFVENTATANGSTLYVGDMPEVVSNTLNIPGIANPGWTLTKSTTASSYSQIGEILSYDMILSNTGNVSISGVTLTDPNTTIGTTITGDTGVSGTLEVGESWTYTASYTVGQADIDAGSHSNTATATGTPAGGTLADVTSNQVVVPAVQAPSWTLTKRNASTSPTYDSAGLGIVYEFTLTNTGNVSISGISMNDPLIPNLNQTPIIGTDIGNDGVLSPGENWRFVGSYFTSQADLDRGFIENIATVTGTPAGGTLSDGVSNTVTVNAVQAPSLMLTKTADRADYNLAGEVIGYELILENTGNVTLTDVSVSDPLTGFNQTIPVFTIGQVVTYPVTNYTATQADLNIGQIQNTATASGLDPQNQVVSTSATSTISAVQYGNIRIRKTSNVQTINDKDDPVIYTLVIENIGNVTLTQIATEDSMLGLNITDPNPLQPGASITYSQVYTSTQSDIDAGLLINSATVNAQTPASLSIQDTASDTVQVNQQPSINLTKTGDTKTLYAVGQIISYEINVQNTGNVSLTNVNVTDPKVGLSESLNLDPGQMQVYSVSHTVTQIDLDLGSYENTATVTATPPIGSQISDTDTWTASSFQHAQLVVVKQVTPKVYDKVGEVLDYTISVTNVGNVTLTNLSVDDPRIPFNTVEPSIAANETKGYNLSYIITQADVDAGLIQNDVTATATQPNGSTVFGQHVAYAVSIGKGRVQLYKKALSGPYHNVGDLLQYELTATNIGSLTLEQVIVSDPLTGFTSAPITLSPGASQIFTSTYTVNQKDLDNGSVNNTATVEGLDSSTAKYSDQSSALIIGIQKPDIKMTKVADKQVFSQIGEVVSYLVEVENTGNVTLSDVNIIDPLTSTDQTIATLLPGQVVTVSTSYTVSIADLNAGTVINNATVTALDPSNGIIQESATEIVNAISNPSIAITKTANQPSFQSLGELISFTIEIENTGNVTLSQVVVNDPLTGLNQSVPDLNPGDSYSVNTNFTITQAELDAGTLVNSATVDARSPSGAAVQSVVEETLTGLQNGTLELNKTVSQTTFVNAGEVVTYSFELINKGNVTLGNVELDDPMIPFSQTIGIMAPGDSQVFSSTYTLSQGDVDGQVIINTATATGVDPSGNSVVDSDPAYIVVQDVGALEVHKSALTSKYSQVGDLLSYEISVTNIGNVTIENVILSDPLTGGNHSVGTLSPSAIFTANETYTVSQADIDAGLITNIASATGTEATPMGTSVSAKDQAVVKAARNGGIKIDKSSLKSTFSKSGELIEYNLLVTNTGNVTLTNILVTDPLIGTSQQISQMAPGEVQTITKVYTVAQSDMDAGKIINIGYASANTPSGESVSDKDSFTILGTLNPEIEITKTGSMNQFQSVGELITYSIIVTNSGNQTLNNVTVVDPLTSTNQNVGDLVPGQSVTITAQYVTTQADLDSGKITNSATVSGTEPLGSKISKVASYEVKAVQLPSMILEKISNTQSYNQVGDVISYNLTVRNTGNVTLKNVTLLDPLTGLNEFIGILNPSQTISFTENYTINQSDIDAGQVVNTASVLGRDPNQSQIKDEATVTVFAELVNLPEIIANDDNLGEFELSFGGSLGNILVNDLFDGNTPLPEDVSIQLINDGGLLGIVIDSNGDVNLISGLNQIGNYELIYSLSEAGNPDNKDEGVIKITLIEDKVDLTIIKSSFGEKIFEGDEFEYEILVTNKSKTSASEILITDDLPNNLSYVSSTIEVSDPSIQVNTQINGSEVTWIANILPEGATITIKLVTKAGRSGVLSNIAFVSSLEEEITSSDNSSMDTNEILPFHVPNVITPNNDGDNDTFQIEGLGKFATYELFIFNRNGDHVYKSDDYKGDWDAEGQSAGTYFYVLKAIDMEGNSHDFKGWIQVIKN